MADINNEAETNSLNSEELANKTTYNINNADDEAKKIRLRQRKARLALEEAKLKVRERKKRTRSLIELGGLVVKAGLDNLSTNILYGALLSLKETLTKDEQIATSWRVLGDAAFTTEQKEKIAVILKLEAKPSQEVRDHIRMHGLKWNSMRQEWWGYTTSLDSLRAGLAEVIYDLEIIKDK